MKNREKKSRNPQRPDEGANVAFNLCELRSEPEAVRSSLLSVDCPRPPQARTSASAAKRTLRSQKFAQPNSRIENFFPWPLDQMQLDFNSLPDTIFECLLSLASFFSRNVRSPWQNAFPSCVRNEQRCPILSHKSMLFLWTFYLNSQLTRLYFLHKFSTFFWFFSLSKIFDYFF